MEIRRVKREKVSEQVFQQMKQMLLQGEWMPGDRLPSEKELSEAFGVSRVTIRQALQQLVALGLVYTKLGEGSFVREPQAGDCINSVIPVAFLGGRSLTEVLEFRQVMDAKVARMAAQRITPEELEQLEQVLRRMASNPKDRAATGTADLDFHMMLATITHNSLIIATTNIIRDVLDDAMQILSVRRSDDAGLRDHEAIMQAIRAHDPAEVERRMQKHIDSICESMRGYEGEQKK